MKRVTLPADHNDTTERFSRRAGEAANVSDFVDTEPVQPMRLAPLRRRAVPVGRRSALSRAWLAVRDTWRYLIQSQP